MLGLIDLKKLMQMVMLMVTEKVMMFVQRKSSFGRVIVPIGNHQRLNKLNRTPLLSIGLLT